MAFKVPGWRKGATDVQQLKCLIYGPSGCGKTYLGSKFPGAMFLATEKGQQFIDGYDPIYCADWMSFQLTIQELHAEVQSLAYKKEVLKFADGQPVKTIIIDTLGNLARYLEDDTCKKAGVKGLEEIEWGRGFKTVSDKIAVTLQILESMPFNVILIAHSVPKAQPGAGKNAPMMESVALSAGAKRAVYQWCDVALYMEVKRVKNEEGKVELKRMLRSTPDVLHDAKDRTGRLPGLFEATYESFEKYIFSPAENAAATTATEP